MPEKDLSELENHLGYSFRDKHILLEALTHKSFFHENPDKSGSYNERLEFLGDSVLAFVIVDYLFIHEKRLTESVMSKTKSYIVKESLLSEIANSLHLGEYLRIGKGEEATGGRKKRSLLADAIEAVFGAVYLDGGLQDVTDLILRLSKEKIDTILSSGEFYDFKTELQEKTQLLYNTTPEYRIILQEGEEHKKIFTVVVYIAGVKSGIGRGKSKKEAETFAAKEALLKITENN